MTRPTRTKVLATLGPASDTPERLEAMILAGMDCARLNFSHGDYDEYARIIALVRETAERLDRPIAIMQDLQGPKIRIGRIEGGSIELAVGETVHLEASDGVGTRDLLTTTYRELPQDVTRGDRILLDDGRLLLVVEEIQGDIVVGRVVEGGVLKEKKGINLPGVQISAPVLTEKDRQDIAFGCEHGVDYVALSFVRSGHDLRMLKQEMRKHGSEAPVIAKLERPLAVDNLDEILAEGAGVMIARGDLGVELPPERVPILQKEIIRRANGSKRLVIVATQMLESMTKSSTPTRAEASDVANAIFDGTDAVMLSAETATGDHPVETIEMMERIIVAAELEIERTPWRRRRDPQRTEDFGEAIGDAATVVAGFYPIRFDRSVVGEVPALGPTDRVHAQPTGSQPIGNSLGGQAVGRRDRRDDRSLDLRTREATGGRESRQRGRGHRIGVRGTARYRGSNQPHEGASDR
jgi:pyruvate kinase